MDFELSDEHIALRDSARDFIAERWSPDRMRQALDTPPAALDGDIWQEMAALGWIGICASEDRGGSGGDVVTAIVLAEEAGRGLLPGPLVSAIAAGRALDRCGNSELRVELLPALFAGDSRATVAFDEPGGNPGLDPVQTVAKQAGDGWHLTGTKICVPDVEGAGTVLVPAAAPEGPLLFAVPAGALTVTPMRRLDAQSIGEVVMDGAVLPSGALCGGGDLVRETFDFLALLTAADLLGGASAALDTAVAYAKERVQFDRPIGSFQAVAHPLADAYVACEIGRSLLYAAALAVEESRPEAPAYVSAAKAWAGETAVSACETALSVHGGIGFTWELDIHLYLRRARAGAVSFGDADFHRDRVAALVPGLDGYSVERQEEGKAR